MRDDTLAVIIPSVNRPATLHETLLSVLRQRRLPGQIILSVPHDDDVLPGHVPGRGVGSRSVSRSDRHESGGG